MTTASSVSRPRSRDQERRSAVAAGAGTALCLLALVVAGRTLAFPSDLRPAALVRWVDAVGTATAAFTVLRAIALALLGWCLLTGLAGVVARRSRRPRAVALVDRLSFRAVRRVAEAAAGLGMVAATLVPAAAPSAGASTRPPVVAMVDIGPSMRDLGPATTVAPEVVPSTAPPVSSAPAEPVLPVPADAAAEPSPGEQVPEGAEPRSWRIEPGDTLWHVAATTAAEALGRPADAPEVAARLDALVALNRGRLAVPDDPGLVFPGQVFLLP